MSTASIPLRQLSGLPATPARLSESALVIVDAQNAYRGGVMQLEGVEPALDECARLLAERTLRESPDRDQRLVALFRRAASRSPDAADLETLRRGLDALVARYRESPTDAEELFRQGASPVASDLDARELAAWMVVASAILNLDESLVRP